MDLKNYSRVNWKNYPDTTTPINAENLNKMDSAIEELYVQAKELQVAVEGTINKSEIEPYIIESNEFDTGLSELSVRQNDDNGEVFSILTVQAPKTNPKEATLCLKVPSSGKNSDETYFMDISCMNYENPDEAPEESIYVNSRGNANLPNFNIGFTNNTNQIRHKKVIINPDALPMMFKSNGILVKNTNDPSVHGWADATLVDLRDINKKLDKFTDSELKVYSHGTKEGFDFNAYITPSDQAYANTLVMRDKTGQFRSVTPDITVTDNTVATTEFVSSYANEKTVKLEPTNPNQNYDSSIYQVYGHMPLSAAEGVKGNLTYCFNISNLPNISAIAQFDVNGRLKTNNPIENNDVTNKDYVDTSLIALKDKLFDVIATTVEEDIPTDNYVVPNAIDSHPILNGINCEVKSIGGDTRQFNQQLVVPTIESQTLNGITLTNNGNGSITLSGTATAQTNFTLMGDLTRNIPLGHKVLITNFKTPSSTTYFLYDAHETSLGTLVNTPGGYIKSKEGSSSIISPSVRIENGITINETLFVMYFDLTSMGLASITNINDFKAQYPLDYYEYDSGSIKNVSLSKIESHSQYASVDLGTLDWIYNSTGKYFQTSGLVNLIKPIANNSTMPNIVSSVYTPTTFGFLANNLDANKIISQTGGNNLIQIRDTAYTDATAFKDAMSGIILKYLPKNPTDATWLSSIDIGTTELYGVGDIKDIKYLDTGKITRRITKHVITESDIFAIGGITSKGLYRYHLTMQNIKKGTAQKGVCDRYPTDYGAYSLTTIEAVRFGQNNAAIYFYLKQNFATSKEVANYLKGTTLYFERATPIEEEGTPITNRDLSFEIGDLIINDNSNTAYGVQATTTTDFVCKEWSI